MTYKEVEFLKESNAIEGVYDADSLAQAIYAWTFLKEQPSLTSSVILKTHKILMLHQMLRPDQRGYFRKIPVYIGGREAMESKDINEYIKALCVDINAGLTDWKEAHIMYEKIHPFVDGNGRTGRMFMNWQRLRAKLPIFVIKEDKVGEYYKWFT